MPRVEQRDVLVYPKCPTGKHPGVVRAELIGRETMMGYESPGRLVIPFPFKYVCGCPDEEDE